MSDRSSFCSEFIYCGACEKKARKVIQKNEWPMLEPGDLPIIAGFHKGLGPDDDRNGFIALMQVVAKAICPDDTLQFAFLGDGSPPVWCLLRDGVVYLEKLGEHPLDRMPRFKVTRIIPPGHPMGVIQVQTEKVSA